MNFDVNTDGYHLRQALAAVLPHVSMIKDDHLRHRLRIYVGLKYLILVATNGFTAAMAKVEIAARKTHDLGCFDLHPQDVRRVLAFFGRGSDQVLQIQWAEKAVTVTDVSGLFPGESLSINAHPVDRKFPNIARALDLVGSIGASDGEGHRLAVPGKRLALFAAASKAYGSVLVVEPSGPWAAPVISCGSRFIGLLVPDWITPDKSDVFDGYRDEWLETYADVTASHPMEPVEPATEEQAAEQVDDETVDGLIRDLTTLLSGPIKTVAKGEDDESEAEPVDVEQGGDSEPAEPGDLDLPEIETVPLFEDGSAPADGEVEWYDGFPSRGEDDQEGAAVSAPVIPAEELDMLQSVVQALAGEDSTSMRQIKLLLNVGQAKAQRVMQLLREFKVISPELSKLPSAVYIGPADLPDIFAKIAAERLRGGSDV